MTQSPTPPITGAEGLPVVAHRHLVEDHGIATASEALTPHAPAQALIDALRDDRDSWMEQASSRAKDAVQFANERDALRSENERLKRASDSAHQNYAIQKRERERLEGELRNCESRIHEQRAEINRLASLQSAGDTSSVECPACAGMGYFDGVGDRCAECAGTGKVSRFGLQSADQARDARQQAFEDQIRLILKGIDKDECLSEDGWFATSGGVKFGTERLRLVVEAIRAMATKESR